jgi:hypothetical protein
MMAMSERGSGNWPVEPDRLDPVSENAFDVKRRAGKGCHQKFIRAMIDAIR